MALKITIIGKVHNVGYRLFLLEEADHLFIPYFDARNVKINGKEALIVLVDGEKEQIEEFLEFVKSEKPESAVVEEIKVEEYVGRVRDIDRFRNSFNTAQLSKIVQVGLRMLEKQDTMLEKQDAMLEKQDAMLGKMDLMLEKQDTMLEKQDAMLEKQDTVLGKMDSMLEKQDETIKVIKEESEKTRQTVREESEKTREVLGEIIREESEKTRQTVKEESKKAREEVGGKIDLLRSDLREYMESSLKIIREEILEIKEALRKAGIM